MRVGVIGDTHGFFHPRIPGVFSGVDKIIHCGDIGGMDVYARLKEIAEVVCVSGNNEQEEIPEAEEEPCIIELAGRRVLITHILTTMTWEYFKGAISLLDELPFSKFLDIEVVIFGHSHYPVWDFVRGIYFLNPGYAGADYREGDATVALLEIKPEIINAEIIHL